MTARRSSVNGRGALQRLVPALEWLPRYRRTDLAADALAGLIVAVMLVPQAMAYAMLAGLPPEAGLYASVLPLVLYAFLGSSRVLAVGPVAVVSLLVATGLGHLGPLEPGEALGVAALLALAVGALQLVLGLLRAGFLVNLLSHPVISGFTSAAALVIALSQLRPLLGLDVGRSEVPWQAVVAAAHALPTANAATVAVGGLSLLVLVAWPRLARRALAGLEAPPTVAELLPRIAPLLVVVLGTLAAWALALHDRAGLAIVREIPAGLPRPGLPALDAGTLRVLAPTVLAIALVGFLESFAVAQALASRRRERVEGNQELVALGVANLGAAFSGGYPVTGGFSRSMVNAGAGARTGVASIVTAGLVALTLLGLTPLLHYLPRAVLAAIIVVAVLPLVDLAAARRAFRHGAGDGLALAATFAGVFALGVETGILVGVATSIVAYLARSSTPHMAVVGRLGDTEHFRNVERFDVRTDPRVLAVRIDENLYFANVRYVVEHVQALVAARPELESVVLICSGINLIDATGLEGLEDFAAGLAEAGIALHLAEVKGPVMDRLEQAGFAERLGRERFHLSTHAALQALTVPEQRGG